MISKMIVICAAMMITITAFSGCVLPIEQQRAITDGTEPTTGAGTGGAEQGNETLQLGENETNDPMQPTIWKNVLYLHVEGGEHWMDILPDESGGDPLYVSSPFINKKDVEMEFKMDPAPSHDIVMNGNSAIVASLNMSVNSTSITYKITASLLIDGSEVSAGEKSVLIIDRSEQHQIELKPIEKMRAGSNVVLRVCVAPESLLQEEVSVITVTLHLGKSTCLTLPIISPTYVERQGISDGSSGSGASSTGNRGAKIEESETSTHQKNGKWYATKTVTITNDFGGANSCDLSLGTCNGYVKAAAWDEGGYKAVAALQGNGNTKDEAMQNLNALKVVHTDKLSGGALTLWVVVEDKSGGNWNGKSASITASVPKSPSYDVTAEATNGAIVVSGIHGGKMAADTTNGAITCTSDFDSLDMGTTNGAIECVGSFNSIELATTNAAIDVETASAASGKYSLATTNGAISLKVKNGADYGYDVSGDTTNGKVTIDISGTEPVGEQSSTSKHVRTTNYDSKSIKIKAALDTTNGAIDVGEA